MADATETNRAVIEQAFKGLRHGNPSHFLPLFAEDIVWRVSMPRGCLQWSATSPARCSRASPDPILTSRN